MDGEMHDEVPAAMFRGAIAAMLRADASACRGLLAGIVDRSPDAIVCRDLAGTITTWNAAAEQLFGYRADEAIDRDILLLVPDDRRHEETELLTGPVAGRIPPFDTVRLRKDGAQVAVLLTIVLIAASDGALVGAVEILRQLLP
jgi:PAS domain S-box-containing protein